MMQKYLVQQLRHYASIKHFFAVRTPRWVHRLFSLDAKVVHHETHFVGH